MSTDLLAPLARLISTAEAIEELRDLFAAEEPLDDIAARVAKTALAAIPNADAVSITALSWPDTRTAASTHECALKLDHHQYASGRGPCLEATWRRTPVRAAIGEDLQRWPEFVEAAQRMGIRASLSVPLLVGTLDEKQELLGRSTSTARPHPRSTRSTHNSCASTPRLPVKRSATPAGGRTPGRLSPSLRRRFSPVQISTWLKEL